METGVESKKYSEIQLFMDEIIENFDIHYLYAIKPLDIEKAKVMSVLCAERYYDRYVDSADNLYLGWISDDEYDSQTVKKIFQIMEQRE